MARPRNTRALGVEANFRCLYRAYKKNAKKRNLSFSLSIERFRELTKLPCLICGEKPKAKYVHDKRYAHPYVYNGVDRLDNRKGYSEENCAPCCRSCNYAKHTKSLYQFLLYIYNAYNHAVAPALQRRKGGPRGPRK